MSKLVTGHLARGNFYCEIWGIRSVVDYSPMLMRFRILFLEVPNRVGLYGLDGVAGVGSRHGRYWTTRFLAQRFGVASAMVWYAWVSVLQHQWGDQWWFGRVSVEVEWRWWFVSV